MDKTPFALKLIKQPGAFFFCRAPDALAKVLFVDTLKEIFEGNENLFGGALYP